MSRIGRKVTVGSVGEEHSKVHTVYDCQSRIDKLDVIAKTLGLSRSELYRQATQPYIDKYETGEIKKIEFDLEQKKAELLRARQDEQKWRDQLEKIPFEGRQTGLGVMLAFAKRLGTDDTLTKDIDVVLLKLQTFEPNGGKIDRALLNVFVFFVEAVLKRRAIDNEITEYYRKKAAG